MPAERTAAEPRVPTGKWRHLPDRIPFENMTESVPDGRVPPAAAATAGDPETAWMLRHA
jgi:hypothetical protein